MQIQCPTAAVLYQTNDRLTRGLPRQPVFVMSCGIESTLTWKSSDNGVKRIKHWHVQPARTVRVDFTRGTISGLEWLSTPASASRTLLSDLSTAAHPLVLEWRSASDGS